MDYLPPHSAVALTLSCTSLKYLLGSKHYSSVNSSTSDKLALLNLLALDLPSQTVCPACKKLHDMRSLNRYNIATYLQPWHNSFSAQLWPHPTVRIFRLEQNNLCDDHFHNGHEKISQTTRVYKATGAHFLQNIKDNSTKRVCAAI